MVRFGFDRRTSSWFLSIDHVWPARKIRAGLCWSIYQHFLGETAHPNWPIAIYYLYRAAVLIFPLRILFRGLGIISWFWAFNRPKRSCWYGRLERIASEATPLSTLWTEYDQGGTQVASFNILNIDGGVRLFPRFQCTHHFDQYNMDGMYMYMMSEHVPHKHIQCSILNHKCSINTQHVPHIYNMFIYGFHGTSQKNH